MNIKNLPTPTAPLWGIWNPNSLSGLGCWLQHVGYRGDGPVSFEDRDQAVMSAHAEFELGCLGDQDDPVLVALLSGSLDGAMIVEIDSTTLYTG